MLHPFKKSPVSWRVFPLIGMLLFSGCAIKVLPIVTDVAPTTKKPVIRLGEVNETVTGTWNIYPEAGFKSALLKTLRREEIASYFSNDISNLVLDIHITTDHADDGPRLSNLGALSIVTLGIIPLNYVSNWDTSCDVSITTPEGIPVADYVFHETGTYNIWAMPWTPLTLLGAGIRGEHDGGVVANRVTYSLARKIVDALEQNYDTLAAKSGHKAVAKVEKKATYAVPSATLVT